MNTHNDVWVFDQVDVNVVTVLDAMTNNLVSTSYVSITLLPLLLFTNAAHDATTKMIGVTDVNDVNIDFIFENDTHNGYTSNKKDYVLWLNFKPYMYDSSNTIYFLEIIKQCGGAIIIKIVKNERKFEDIPRHILLDDGVLILAPTVNSSTGSIVDRAFILKRKKFD
ncbi:hypothetical protein A3Q56_08117 [Intoshia linei]|uniref:Uncharacterized protein n=1 Tax=Intoshia linei TaxID=1819745 RepID=A0A177AS05_9BILA|nr:hypothetical protein A3Q56_08117 [Intoshia linei]